LSFLGAFALTRFGLALEGDLENIFEGVTMLLAAATLTWMIFWMNRQAQTMKRKVKNHVREVSLKKGKGALFWLAFLAILRKGGELALFLIATAFAGDYRQTLIGAILGLVTTIFLGRSIFASAIRLDLAIFFQSDQDFTHLLRGRVGRSRSP
jgi:high-affinity iron transporter